ncbi:MAG TPA: helix-turn-helix domain-containing protein [Chthoniobacterales bacterium]|nr:helix-turn-helix domain-containing protein [Chthoniobacterales bacterium]
MLITERCGFVDRRIETFDPETLLEVIRDGRFDHRLLEGGSFEIRHRRVVFGNSSLDCGDYSPAFAVNGQFSEHQVCLGFTPRIEKPAWCNGFNIGKGEIMCFAEGTELQFRNAPNTTWQVILVDRKELQDIAMILTGQHLELPEKGTANFRARDSARSVSSTIELALTDLSNPDTLASPAAYSLCEEIVNEFVRTIATTDDLSGRSLTGFAGYRYGAMRRAEEYLREHMDKPFSSRALCEATHMSERSIEMLFKEVYGISPRTWSQLARLNAARQELLRADVRIVSVTAVATRWGFYHFGRFSAAYRRLFGEVPSATILNRRRRTVVQGIMLPAFG